MVVVTVIRWYNFISLFHVKENLPDQKFISFIQSATLAESHCNPIISRIYPYPTMIQQCSKCSIAWLITCRHSPLRNQDSDR